MFRVLVGVGLLLSVAAAAELIVGYNSDEPYIRILVPTAVNIDGIVSASQAAQLYAYVGSFSIDPAIRDQGYLGIPVAAAPICFRFSRGKTDRTPFALQISTQQIANIMLNIADASVLPLVSGQLVATVTTDDVIIVMPNRFGLRQSVSLGLAASNVFSVTNLTSSEAYFDLIDAVQLSSRIVWVPAAVNATNYITNNAPPQGKVFMIIGDTSVGGTCATVTSYPNASQVNYSVSADPASAHTYAVAQTPDSITSDTSIAPPFTMPIITHWPIDDVFIPYIPTNYPFWTPLMVMVQGEQVCQYGVATAKQVLANLLSSAAKSTLSTFLYHPFDRVMQLRFLGLGVGAAARYCTGPDASSTVLPLIGSDTEVDELMASLAVTYCIPRRHVALMTYDDGVTYSGFDTVAIGHALAALTTSTSVSAAVANKTVVMPRLIPFMAALVSLRFNFGVTFIKTQDSVVLDICTIVGIFNGSVTRWDSDLVSKFNPPSVVYPSATIQVVLARYSSATKQFLKSLAQYDLQCSGRRTTLDSAWEYAAAGLALVVDTEADLRSKIGGTAFTIGPSLDLFFDDTTITTYAVNSVTIEVNFLSASPDATAVVNAYSTGVTLNTTTFALQQQSSTQVNYPFLLTFYIAYAHDVVIKNQLSIGFSTASCQGVAAIATFLQWCIQDQGAASQATTNGFLWLGGYDSALATAAVLSMTCNGAPVYPPPSGGLSAVGLGLIIAFCIVVVFLINAAAGCVILRSRTRDVSHAPKEKNAPFAIAFTDIESSTTLWARSPQAMGHALDHHHKVIRQMIEKHRCYEVKTIGDAFMVACEDPRRLLLFALDVQDELMHSQYPDNGPADIFDAIYIDKRREAISEAPGDCPYLLDACLDDRVAYDTLWRGLRVRIGLHYGHGEIQYDDVSKGYDYYGSVVNAASRVESSGHGGQVLITAAMLEGCGGRSFTDSCGLSVEAKGSVVLRGFDDPVELLQVSRPHFIKRFFPPLKTEDQPDKATEAMEAAAENVSISSYESSSPGVFVKPHVERARAVANWISKLLSTSPPDAAWRLLEELCSAWRINLPAVVAAKGRAARTPQELKQCIAMLARRVSLVFSETHSSVPSVGSPVARDGGLGLSSVLPEAI